MMGPNFFKHNRQALTAAANGGLIVVGAYSSMQRGNDAAHKFEQEANFWYLCGINEPDWLLVVDGVADKSWLIAPDIDEVHRIFEGGMSFDQAKKISGVDSVVAAKEGDALLRQLARTHSVVRTLDKHPASGHFNFHLNPTQARLKAKLERIFSAVLDCRNDLAKLRAIKQPEEIAAIKKAIKLTTDSFESVKKSLSNLAHEYEIEAEFSYAFKNKNADHAYDPIVASGVNACTLHYTSNNQALARNQLVLMDIGARVDGYAADITRTYARSVPTKRQAQVHNALAQAHHEIISLLKPSLSVELYQREVSNIMLKALQSLGLVKTDEQKALRQYFPHAVSHGLGIDVHDSLGSPKVFEPNMVLTVEPGIYIPEEKIGIRIEDDILITKIGQTNLSKHLSTEL